MTLFDIDRIAFSYDRTHPVVRDLSLAIPPGSFYGIIGPNGSGKTTLLDLLTGHLTPEKGRVLFKGKGVNRYSRKFLAREISLVTQNFYINFPYTVYEIVMMGRYPYIGRFGGPSPDDLSIVERVMVKTGIDRFRNRYITELSGGERQRVVVARVFAQETGVILLDEATSNLDVQHALLILDMLHQEVRIRKKTVISVFQDINLALLYCDRLIVMKEGRLYATGKSETVMTEALLSQVFGVSSKVYADDYAEAIQVVFRKKGGGGGR